MNIVKQFEDFLFFKKHYPIAVYLSKKDDNYWRWGLGDDGELYYSHSEKYPKDKLDYWFPFKKSNLSQWLSFREMKKIVKEFGHLVVFT